KGGQAGQPDRAVDQQNQASDQYKNRDNTARDRSDLPVSFTVPAGTKIDAKTTGELSSRKNKPGDTLALKVSPGLFFRELSSPVVLASILVPAGTVNETGRSDRSRAVLSRFLY